MYTRLVAFLVSTFIEIRPKGRFIRSYFCYLDGYNHESASTNMPRTPNNITLVREY